MKELGFNTKMIHAGQKMDSDTMSRALPLYQTTAYGFKSVQHAADLFELKEPGNIYTRLQNPTNGVLEERVAALDGGIGGVATASGHAAMLMAFMNLCSEGDEFVSSICIYGGAINMMGVSLKRVGINVKFVEPDDLDAWEKAITDKTKFFFVEGVGNPNANVADIEKIAEIAHKHGIPLIVDSTFTTPYLLRPIEWGADIVIHSATKFLGGHGNSMEGLVIDSGNFKWLGNPRFPLFNEPDPSYHGVVFAKDYGNAGFITRLRALIMRDYGAVASPFNSYMILMGVETLSLRMQRHSDNALKVAEFLENSKYVDAVNYPGLKSSKYHKLAEKYLPNGCGGVFTFALKGTRETGAKFIEALKLFSHVANVGDTRSLVIHPASTTHSQLTDEQLKEAGITPTTIRLSIGLEDINDIIGDLKNAMEIANK